jgi:hypothetical protein
MVRGYLPTRWRNMILPVGAMVLMINLGDPQKLLLGPLDDLEEPLIVRLQLLCLVE